MPIYKFSNAGGFGTFQRYNDFLAGNPASSDLGAMFPLQVITVSGAGITDVTFTNIPSTYAHLQIRVIGRVANADTADNMWINFNSDTNSNYSWHYLEGDGSTAAAGAASNQSRILSGRISAANATSGIFGVAIIDILDYGNTNKYKTVRTLCGLDRNGSGNVRLDSGSWRNTSAITSIKLTNGSATNFVQYSQFALYGIKGA